MLISKTFRRINQCLEVSESLNLSNNEEEKITLELLRNFKKLLILILSRKEKQKFKQKVNLIKETTHLETLKSKIQNPSLKIHWQSNLSFKTNILLQFSNNHDRTLLNVHKNLIKKIDQPFNNKKSKTTLYDIEYKECKSTKETNQFFSVINKEIKKHKLKQIILPSKCFIAPPLESTVSHLLKITKKLNGNLILNVSYEQHLDKILDIISTLCSLNIQNKIGISLPINNKKTMKYIDQLFKKVPENKRHQLIIRITKGSTEFTRKKNNITFEQQVRINTYYKWSIFTIMNYVRKNKCDCIINSHNMYDISWILVMRAQMDIEKKIKFESNLTKFPNVTKVLYMINLSPIKSETLLLDTNLQNKTLTIIDHLIHEGRIYNEFKNSKLNQKTIFVKSHRRFFNYLKRNFLEKYLNKFDE